MYRCAALAFAATVLASCASGPGADPAQTRAFPQNTLRGTLVVDAYPNVALNGKATTLTPGSRVRDQNNMIVMAASLAGARLLVNYTLDMGGEQVRDVWILTPGEAAVRPWPATLEQAQTWTYDATTMTWSKL